MSVQELLKDLAIAPIAGYVGTKVMEPLGTALYNAESPEDRQREDAARPGPPFEIAAKKTLGAIGVILEGDALKRVGLAFHYGLGISWAPVYVLLRRSLHMRPIAAGLAAGAAMSALVDEGITPMLGFSAKNTEYPLATHVRGLIGHLVFGLSIAAVTEAAWMLTDRQP